MWVKAQEMVHFLALLSVQSFVTKSLNFVELNIFSIIEMFVIKQMCEMKVFVTKMLCTDVT